MFDRQFFGDVALAVLLAIPIAALTQPNPVSAVQADTAFTAQAQHVGSAADRPISLLR